MPREIEITEAQKEKVLEFRPFFKQLSEELQQCGETIVQVEKALENKNSKIEQAIHKLTTVISPRQAAQFIQWVTDNQACIHMLNKLWQVV